MLAYYLASWIFVRIACEYSVATTTLGRAPYTSTGKKASHPPLAQGTVLYRGENKPRSGLSGRDQEAALLAVTKVMILVSSHRQWYRFPVTYPNIIRAR